MRASTRACVVRIEGPTALVLDTYDDLSFDRSQS